MRRKEGVWIESAYYVHILKTPEVIYFHCYRGYRAKTSTDYLVTGSKYYHVVSSVCNTINFDDVNNVQPLGFSVNW